MYTSKAVQYNYAAILAAASKKILWSAVVLTIAAGTGVAGDQAYRKTRLPDAKGKQPTADVVFKSDSKVLEVKVAGHGLVGIPYDAIDNVSYEYTRHHRITQGAVVMVASLGAGAVVMLTQSKHHFLTIGYHEGTVAKELVLRLHKSEYEGILKSVQEQTGKEVALVDRASENKQR